MADKSAIEWTEATWNPVAGCSLVSPGCAGCYAMKMAARLEAMGQASYAGLTQPSKAGPVWTGKIALVESALAKPLRWRRPRRIFVNSMSDLFHEAVPDSYIDKVFAVMALAPQHTFQVLTKRADRMRDYMQKADGDRHHRAMTYAACMAATGQYTTPAIDLRAWPLPNVWLGVSVEDQKRADERIPLLLDTPAAVRWISAEPLLGPVDLTWLTWPDELQDERDGVLDSLRGRPWIAGDAQFHPVVPNWRYADGTSLPRQYLDDPTQLTTKLDWVVVGGESGPDARPIHPDWARSLRDQCASAGVPFFFKQWGGHWPGEIMRIGDGGEVWRSTANGGEEWFLDETGKTDAPPVRFTRVGKHAAGRELDGRTHDEYPR